MKIYTLNQYVHDKYGQKLYKIALDGGFTCPNRDGAIDNQGMYFLLRGRLGRICRGSRDEHYPAD